MAAILDNQTPAPLVAADVEVGRGVRRMLALARATGDIRVVDEAQS